MIIEQAFRLLKQYFANTKILTYKELTYLLPNYSDSDYEKLLKWFLDMIEFDYMKQIPPATQEIFINNLKYYKDNDQIIQLITSLEDHHWQLHFEILAFLNQQEWSFNKPFTSFFVEMHKRQFRVSLTHHTLTPRSSSFAFLRTIRSQRFDLKSFTDYEQAEFTKKLVSNKSNIIIAGATGSGKTSFLSATLAHIPIQEHLILIEDTKEILPHPNTTELIANRNERNSLKSLCEYSLRMSPDRVIIGEMRSDEVIPFLLMMNTGHRGLMSTIHSNSAVEAINRCAFLFSMYSQKNSLSYESSLKMVAQNIDYVIYLKDKKIDHIIKVLGSEKQNCFFEKISFNTNEKSSYRISV